MRRLRRTISKTLTGIFLATQLFSGCGANSSPEDGVPTKPFIKPAVEETIQNDTSEKYAIILNGIYENGNAELDIMAMRFLLKKNYFPDKNIYTLSNNQNQNGIPYPPNGSFTRENLEKLVDVLSTRIDHNDFLFFYMVDHVRDSSSFDSKKRNCLCACSRKRYFSTRSQ